MLRRPPRPTRPEPLVPYTRRVRAMSFLGLYRDPTVAATTAACDWHIADLMDSEKPVSLYLDSAFRYLTHQAAGAVGAQSDRQIGRAHVCTPVTNAHLVCRLLLVKQKNEHTNNHTHSYNITTK